MYVICSSVVGFHVRRRSQSITMLGRKYGCVVRLAKCEPVAELCVLWCCVNFVPSPLLMYNIRFRLMFT